MRSLTPAGIHFTPYRTRLARIAGILTSAGLLFALGAPMAAFGVGGEQVTICHAAGQDGTTQFLTLTLPYTAVYGQAGHFYENGTPRAGHEEDYVGTCLVESTATTVADTSTTTTASESTTTTASESTTTTASESTTTTTVAAATTTTTPPSGDPEVEAVVSDPGPDDGSGDITSGTTESFAPATPSDDEVVAETLPFTGFEDHLIVPALVLLLAGVFAVYITRGFRTAVGMHASVDSDHFGLGLHRGRHEPGSF